MKAASPQKSPPPPSPKVTPQKLSPTKTIHSEQSPSKTLRKSPRATQKKSYNVDSDEDEKNEKESLPNGKRKQKEIDEDFDAETIDFESEEESENRLNGNENTAQSAEASSVKSSKKKTAKHKSPMKPGKAKKKQIVSNSETESYQDKIDTDSVSEIAPDSSVNNKSKSSKTMKTGDSVKKRRSLNVKDAVQAVLDSDMDTYSVVSSESGSDDDRLVITIKKNRKRKLTSDDDNSEYSVSTKKRASKSKKKSPKKPPSKKAKIESESESEVSSHQTSPRKSPPKKPSSDSEDSGDDRLQIDVGVSKKNSKMRGQRGAMVRKYFESDSELENESVRSESFSKWADSLSLDSGVNFDSSIGKNKTYRKTKMMETPKSDKEQKSDSEEDETHHAENSVQQSSDDEMNKSRSQYSRKKSLSRSAKTDKQHRPGQRSVFSLSETESDQNWQKKRQLFKEFRQRNIQKILEEESFDVKPCSIVLQQIDNHIDWDTKTCKASQIKEKSKSSNQGDISDSGASSCSGFARRKYSALKTSTPNASRSKNRNPGRFSGNFDSSDSESDSLPLAVFKRKDTNSETTSDAENIIYKKKVRRTRRSLNSTRDSDDFPLRTVRNRQKRNLISRFNSDDLTLMAIRNKQNNTLNTTNDSENVQLKSLKNQAVHSSFNSDDLPLKTVKGRSRKKPILNSTLDSNDFPTLTVSLTNCANSDNEFDKSFRGKTDKRQLNSTFDSDDMPLKAMKSTRRKTLNSTMDSEGLPLKNVTNKRKNKTLNSTFSSDDLPLKTLKGKPKYVFSDSDSSDEDQFLCNLMKRNKDEEFVDDGSLPNTLSTTTFSEAGSEPKRVSMRILKTDLDASPAKSTRSHTKSHDRISESESGSDIESLNDSVRSLEMLKMRKRKLPKKIVVSNQAKKVESDNGHDDSDSDMSSIIEAKDDGSTSMIQEVTDNDDSFEATKNRREQLERTPEKKQNGEVS